MQVSSFGRCRLLQLGLALLMTLAACQFASPSRGSDPPDSKSGEKREDLAPPTKAELTDQRMIFMKAALSRFAVKLGDREEPARVGDPCLRFTNPLTDVTDGVVALYAFDRGRPAVLAQFFRNAPRSWVTEFAIMSELDVTILREDRPFWKPAEYVSKFTDLPDSPVPAAKPVLRLVQMRNIAEDFSVVDHFGAQEITKYDLRLLSKPVYRYSGEGKILDGCLFIFALGTNPECSLLLEAYQDENGSRYRYALSPVTIYELEAQYKGRPVWGIERRMVFGSNCRTYYASGYSPAPGETVPE